ncbi:hypothetical protein EA462_17220 [Natrarchaeobius halalkaliphilus]|uniref:DUF3267 domain-containing protein n=1 Tax=Natrarchaeobius halalkaliphilus TaxID=1679091 RepID=A0A3N6LHV3_9EURY|nr:hypothetical protein [Natrarchaeobius halalkaliphilus]RQG86215.1 hypothetical protein EA462_17220 [Natrarchaeobius halalkaliphilus]
MIGANVVVAGCGLVIAVVVGLVVHEWLHALVLRLANIEYTISYAPDRTDGILAMLASCPWAVVDPHPTGREPPWVFRLAALAPLGLAAPVFAVAATGGLTAGSPLETAVTIGLLACSLPSPQDFSVAFYAHRMLAEDTNSSTRRSRAT